MSCTFDMVPETVDHLDEVGLRRVFGCFPCGVIAVCAMVDDQPVGMAASSFTSVSVDPPLVSICVQNCSTTWPKLRDRLIQAASCPSASTLTPSRGRSRKEGNRFAGVFWSELSSGGVVIAGAGAWLDCRPYAEIPAGDHLIALLEICAVRADPETPPLVFHGSRFRRLESR